VIYNCQFYKYIFIIFLFASIFAVATLFSGRIGSNTKVKNFTSQQRASNGDVFASFSFCRGGFKLVNSSVSATWDSIYPVSGNIDFNGGTLSLGVDLVLIDSATIKTLGTIIGNDYKMELPPSIESFPETLGAGDFSDINILLNGDVAINNSTITFKGDSSIDGMGHLLDLDQNSTIIIDSNASLYLKNITIAGILGSNICCSDDTASLYLDNVEFILDGNYDFSYGKFEIFNNFSVVGDGCNFAYKTDQESIISKNGRFILDYNVTFSYDPHIANRDLINLFDETSELILQGATLFSTKAGLRLKKGKIIVERRSFVSCDGIIESEAISFGDGSDYSNDISVEHLSILEITNGLVLINNVNG